MRVYSIAYVDSTTRKALIIPVVALPKDVVKEEFAKLSQSLHRQNIFPDMVRTDDDIGEDDLEFTVYMQNNTEIVVTSEEVRVH